MVVLTQELLNYFNNPKNYKPHHCHHMGCMCPPNGIYWEQYDLWVRLGKPYTLEDIVVEKDTYKLNKKFKSEKYILGFIVILFTTILFFILLLLCIKN